MAGFIPRGSITTKPGLLYTAIGILGATVMPHNLFLHSAVIQTRNYARIGAPPDLLYPHSWLVCPRYRLHTVGWEYSAAERAVYYWCIAHRQQEMK